MLTPFIPPGACNNAQLTFITAVYGYILYFSSNLISDGSEELQLIPPLAGIVGSIVLPVLGAVPDGMMTLMSGMGPDAQEEVKVGVGVLAGSTIMLITLPWFMGIIGGRVPLKDGVPNYGARSVKPMPVLQSGVGVLGSIKQGALVMIGTSFLYLIVQIPASMAEKKDPNDLAKQSEAEKTYALVGVVVTFVVFVLYLCSMYLSAQESIEDKMINKIVAGIKAKQIGVSAALDFARRHQSEGTGANEPLINQVKNPRLLKIVKPFFHYYDTNNDKTIDVREFKSLLRDLGEKVDDVTATQVFAEADTDCSGTMNLDEFVNRLVRYITEPQYKQMKVEKSSTIEQIEQQVAEENAPEDDEQDDKPDDDENLSPAEQQRKILFKACYMMGIGTLLVLLFSDPMVDCLGELGARMEVSPFYIAFLLAPMASNASELISAYNYASKKTKKSMTTALQTLEGAACMNNTLGLGVFYCLVYFKSLAWTFTAETLAIMLVQWIIGVIVYFKKTQSFMTGLLIISCYPLTLVFVNVLENQIGLD